MSLSAYWLLPPRWSSCPKEEIFSILNQAFGSTGDTQDQTTADNTERDSTSPEGDVIALAVGLTDADYDFTPTLLMLIPPIPTSMTPAQALADSAWSMSDQVPGFRTLEDCEWPARPESSHLRMGIHIQGSVLITACQWVQIHSDSGNDFLLTAITTVTTPTFGDLNDDVFAIIVSLRMRNAWPPSHHHSG